MAASRRTIELSLGDTDTAKLNSIAQSRTEPADRVERARILLAYREQPSFFAVGRALGLHHLTVRRCVERAVAEGPITALDDRRPPNGDRGSRRRPRTDTPARPSSQSTERKRRPRRPLEIAHAIALRMVDADMLGRSVVEDILTAAEVKHGHTIAMIAFEEYDWVTRNSAPRWPPF